MMGKRGIDESRSRNEILAQRVTIRTLKQILLASLVVIFGLVAALWTAPSRLDVHVPPDISGGTTLSAGEIPKPNVYNFAYAIWQQLNYWPDDGAKDVPKLLGQYQEYLSPSFRNALKELHDKRLARGEGRGRTRTMQEVPGQGYQSVRVRVLNGNRWVVTIDTIIEEYVNNTRTKRIGVKYPLIIERRAINDQLNPWGLQIVGFDAPPTNIILPGDM